MLGHLDKFTALGSLDSAVHAFNVSGGVVVADSEERRLTVGAARSALQVVLTSGRVAQLGVGTWWGTG